MDMISSGVLYVRGLGFGFGFGFGRNLLVGLLHGLYVLWLVVTCDCCLYPVMRVSQLGLGSSAPICLAFA